jgi:hypothetical protein
MIEGRHKARLINSDSKHFFAEVGNIRGALFSCLIVFGLRKKTCMLFSASISSCFFHVVTAHSQPHANFKVGQDFKIGQGWRERQAEVISVLDLCNRCHFICNHSACNSSAYHRASFVYASKSLGYGILSSQIHPSSRS